MSSNPRPNGGRNGGKIVWGSSTFVIFIVFVVMASACAPSRGQADQKISNNPTVYVAGWCVKPPKIRVPGLWIVRGRSTTWIPMRNPFGDAYTGYVDAVSLHDSSVYVVGSFYNGVSKMIAGYWVVIGHKSKWFTFPSPYGNITAFMSEVGGIAFSGSSVVVGGSVAPDQMHQQTAGFWTSSVSNDRQTTWTAFRSGSHTSGNEIARAFTSSDGAFYEAVQTPNNHGTPVVGYWKASANNSTWVPCPNPFGSGKYEDAATITVHHGDVIVGGYVSSDQTPRGLSKAGLWIDAGFGPRWIQLANPDGSSLPFITSVTYANSTVYVGGQCSGVAGYWTIKDDHETWIALQDVTTRDDQSEVESLGLSNSTLFAAGIRWHHMSDLKGGFWLHRGHSTEWFPFQNPYGVQYNSGAEGITVYP